MRGGGLILVAIHCTVCVSVVVEIFTSALFTIPFTRVHVYNVHVHRVLVVQCTCILKSVSVLSFFTILCVSLYIVYM